MPFYGSTNEGINAFTVLGLAVVMTGSLIGAIFGVLLPASSTGLTFGVLVSVFISTVCGVLLHYHIYITLHFYDHPQMYYFS